MPLQILSSATNPERVVGDLHGAIADQLETLSPRSR